MCIVIVCENNLGFILEVMLCPFVSIALIIITNRYMNRTKININIHICQFRTNKNEKMFVRI